jgi:hypothetical protein
MFSKKSILSLLILVNVGCSSSYIIRSKDYYKAEVPTDTNEKPLAVRKESSYMETQHLMLAGLLPLNKDVSLKEACSEDVFIEAKAYSTLTQSILSVLTVGIYTPRNVEVWCAKIDN